MKTIVSAVAEVEHMHKGRNALRVTIEISSQESGSFYVTSGGLRKQTNDTRCSCENTFVLQTNHVLGISAFVSSLTFKSGLLFGFIQMFTK